MEDETLTTVVLALCDQCLDGIGGECHTPGCALWMNRSPDVSIHSYCTPFVNIIDLVRNAVAFNKMTCKRIPEENYRGTLRGVAELLNRKYIKYIYPIDHIYHKNH